MTNMIMNSAIMKGTTPRVTSSIFILPTPARTSPEIIKRLHNELAKVLAEPETRARLLKLGFEPGKGTPESLAAFVQSESARWAGAIRKAGIKVD